MSAIAMLAHQARYDLRTFSRDPRARGFTLAVPVIMLVFFGSVFRHTSFHDGGVTLGGVSYYLPRMIVLGMSSVALSNLIITLVAERESGALKRRRATPVRPGALIGGDAVTCEVSSVTIAIVLTAIGTLAFGAPLSAASAGATLLVVLAGTAALCAMAYAVTPLLKSVDATGPAIMIVTIVLNIISGIYVPESIFPAWLRDAAQVLPIRPLATAMQAAAHPQANGGHLFDWAGLGIVGLWGLAATVIAIRRFSWTPSQL